LRRDFLRGTGTAPRLHRPNPYRPNAGTHTRRKVVKIARRARDVRPRVLCGVGGPEKVARVLLAERRSTDLTFTGPRWVIEGTHLTAHRSGGAAAGKILGRHKFWMYLRPKQLPCSFLHVLPGN
jgi:hypothetical protein